MKHTRVKPSKWWVKWTAGSILDRFDLFQVSLPSFNLAGKTGVSSLYGGFMTLALMFTLMLYALVKLVHLTSRHNPNISTFLNEDYYDTTHEVNLDDAGLRFAFGIEG